MNLKIIALGALTALVSSSALAKPVSNKTYKKLEILSKVLSFVETNYIEPVNTEKLVDNAIKGMLSELDPHTMLLPPEKSREMKEDTSGEFAGVGIEMTMKGQQIVIVAPIEGGPAQKAGVQAGDILTKVNGKTVKRLEEAMLLIKGKGIIGEVVKLTLLRDGQASPLEISVIRQQIETQSVVGELLDQEYGYVRIKSFQARTDQELARLLKQFQAQAKPALKGIILDLRGNPGGLLEQAVRVSDTFLKEGVIVTTRGREGTYEEVKMAQNDGGELNVPIIVVVNAGSASASEIVAGALQDHKKAIILGTPTFGKGSVQTFIDLDDGSLLKLTIALYYTPNGRSIQAEGIKPDIFVSPQMLTEKTEDKREKDLSFHLSSDTPQEKIQKTPYRYVRLESDIQMTRALEYMKSWQVFRNTAESSAVGKVQK